MISSTEIYPLLLVLILLCFYKNIVRGSAFIAKQLIHDSQTPWTIKIRCGSNSSASLCWNNSFVYKPEMGGFSRINIVYGRKNMSYIYPHLTDGKYQIPYQDYKAVTFSYSSQQQGGKSTMRASTVVRLDLAISVIWSTIKAIQNVYLTCTI